MTGEKIIAMKVISEHNNTEAFERRVNINLNNGWVLWGDFMAFLGRDLSQTFVQAMVKLGGDQKTDAPESS